MIKLMKMFVLFLCISGIHHAINAAEPRVFNPAEPMVSFEGQVPFAVTVNGALPVDINVNPKAIAAVVGGFILAKSLYDGLWTKDDPKSITMQELLNKAENKQDDTEQKTKPISELIHENRNLIGGIVGCLLLLNKQILGLAGL